MALTPIDVQQKTFGTALRGYDLDEVDDFLDEVVTTLKSYEERLVESQERIAALQAELEGKGDSESAISRALVTAQRSADALVAEAQTDSERVKSEARAEADRILSEANLERERLDASRAEEQQRLDVELSGMREKIAAIRARVLDLNASIESNLAEMDATVAADEEPIVDAEPELFVSDDSSDGSVDAPEEADTEDEPSSYAMPVEDVTESGPSSESKWYETSTDNVDQELDFDLDGDDESAASAMGEDEGYDVDAQAESDGADPLDEVIAEATFQPHPEDGSGDSEGNHVDVEDDGWSSAVVDAATAQDIDEAQGGEEDTSEAWEEVWGSDDDDRPRRPWE